MARQTAYWAFGGGLDLVTPAVQTPEGRMIAGRNFEPWINGGYRRIFGYERFDGRPRPSDAGWVTLTLAEALPETPLVEVGNTLSGQTSGATGVIIEISDDRMTVHLTKVTGDFEDAEDLDDDTLVEVGVATIDGDPAIDFAENAAEEGPRRLLAENVYRTDIQQVPGIGPVRGVWQILDRVYSFRDNVSETAGVIHKATNSGWSTAPIEMAHYVYFTTGTAAPSVGDTLTGATSSATGTIHKVIVHIGSWGTGDAAGYFVLTGVTGTFSSGENLQVSAATKAVASGDSAQFTLPPGGRYDFRSENFYAGSDTYRVYGANGVGPAFEIDENDIVSPLLLDLTMGDAPEENKPFLVESFNGQLWLAFPGGSVQHSITGEPLVWNGFLGAADYGLGSEVQSLTATAGDVLVVRTRRQTHGFYIGETDYIKKIISDRAGGIIYSDQELDTSYSMDDSGLTSLQRVQAFGDFASSTISDLVQPFLESRRGLVAGSMVIRASNQYRCLYTNGEGIIARMRPDGIAEWGLIVYPTTIHCAYSCEDENGSPTNWFAGDSGYVYQAETGRNFDGEEIEATIRLPFAHQGAPSVKKRYHLFNLEIEGERDVELLVSVDLNYANSDITVYQDVGEYMWGDSVIGGGGFWDISRWDRVYWDSQQFSTARFELSGSARNISLLFHNSSATTSPFVLQGGHIHFTPRVVQR
ncbi:MAG: hypothetical protein KDE03_17675 [Rhodobacteraceae bacterium]|nr:hypothetical protein [Paracoccaceae bacterium]